MIFGLLCSKNVHHQSLSLYVESPNPKAGLRKVERFFCEEPLSPKEYAKAIVELVGFKEKFDLCLDRTNWNFGDKNINYLVLSWRISKKISLPLLFVDLDKAGNSNTSERLDLLEEFNDVFGFDRIKSLMADCEFIGKKWFKTLHKNKIPYFIRVKENILLPWGTSKPIHAKNLFQYLTDNNYRIVEKEMYGHTVYFAGTPSKIGELVVVMSNQNLKAKQILDKINGFNELSQNDGAFYIILSTNVQTKLPEGLEQINIPNLPEDGFYLRMLEWKEKPTLIAVGDGLPALIYAINEVGENFLKLKNGHYTIPAFSDTQKPALPYRLFFTWDHSTNWHLNQWGKQELGCFNNYMKPSSGFLEDYKRLVDFASFNRISGITIYGFLRDNHGGIASAQELCRYAKERGVRIIPGVGINAYGGIYWEGNHKYNLTNWLKQNPHLRATFNKPICFSIPEFPELWFPETSYSDAACPSKPENLEYHREAIAWLAETFDIGGINFETGDYGACSCKDCSKRRKEESTWSIKDMQMLYPKLFEATKSKKEDLWMIAEMYWDNILSPDVIAPQKGLPDDAIYQFCVNRSYWNTQVKNNLTSEYVKNMPRSKNVMRTHMGTQWHHERHTLVAEDFAEMANHMKKTGMKGATIFAEPSPFHVVNEINYLAFAQFTYHADMTWEKFVQNILAPRLGGVDAALSYLHLLVTPVQENDLKAALHEARSFADKQDDSDVYRCWIWLQNRLFKQQEMLTL